VLYNINFLAKHCKKFYVCSPNKDATNELVASCNSTSIRHLKSNDKTIEKKIETLLLNVLNLLISYFLS
jgi:hypothetical protein